MKRTRMTAAVALLTGCVASSVQPPPAGDDVRFVVLGPDGVAVARVITTAAACPHIDVDGDRATDVGPHGAGDDSRPAVAVAIRRRSRPRFRC